MSRARDPFTWIALGFALACAVGATWDVPCTDSWSNDEVSPRASMLGAVFETWTPGHFFRYPPLHVLALTVLQSPLILVGVARAGFDRAAIEAELIHPGYMTIAAILGRLVSFAMALGVIANLRRLFARLGGERVGLFAAAATALNAIFVYFAHVASVDVPYLFWTTLALVELDRVAAGEPRERRAAIFVACALLTKDQSAMLLAGPIALLLFARRPVLRKEILRAAGLAIAVYALGSGMVTNPTGFRKKLAFMTGGGNADWVVYERSVSGVLAQLADIGRAVPLFTSRVVAVIALAGVALAVTGADRRDRTERMRRIAPALAAVSYLVLFVVPSRWVMERHLMPLSLFVVPYAGFVLEALARRSSRAALAIAALLLAPQVVDVASIDATLLVDPKLQVEARLATLSPGTKVAVLGGNQYLPRLPPSLDLVRVGTEPLDQRSTLPGVREVVAPYSSVDDEAPEYVVVSETFASGYLPREGPLSGQQKKLLADADGTAFFQGLVAGTGRYGWEVRASCTLPWPLQCRRVHGSTGAEAWLFRRQ